MNAEVWLDELLHAPSKKAMPVLSFPSITLMTVSYTHLPVK